MIIIYISGIDGCGKTTQSKLLVDWLQQNGYGAEYQWLRWEPSVLPLIRRFKQLAGKKSRTSSSKTAEDKTHSGWKSLKSRLMSSSGFRHAWLRYATHDYFKAYQKASRQWSADYIVMDRYITDFIVDQSLNFNMATCDFAEATHATPLGKLQRPQYSIFIDIPAKIGYQRKLDGTSLEYLKEREQLYSSFIGNNILHLDGTAPLETIHQQISDWLTGKMATNHD